MKIAMVGLRALGDTSGGIERAVQELSHGLTARGHEVTVFCRSRYNPQRLRRYGRIRLISLPAIYTKHWEAISHTFLAMWWCAWGYDVVHVHGPGPSLLAFIPRLCGRKVVVTVHAADWRRAKWNAFARWVLRVGARAAVCFSHRTIVVSRELLRYYGPFARGKVHQIPNGVPAARVRSPARILRFGIRGGDYVLFLGRLVPEKGCHLLVRAWLRMATSYRLLVVGATSHTDHYVRELQKMAQGDQRILFAGPLYGEEKDEAYSNAVCLVFPSMVEGMPIVLLEALSYGCPVLCSDIPENLEVITPEGSDPNGKGRRWARTFRAGAVDDLEWTLTAMLNDPAAIKREAERARQYVRRRFGWEKTVWETERLYHELGDS